MGIYIGAAMIALIFIALFLYIIYTDGAGLALKTFAITAALVAWSGLAALLITGVI